VSGNALTCFPRLAALYCVRVTAITLDSSCCSLHMADAVGEVLSLLDHLPPDWIMLFSVPASRSFVG
jgi:hypothetical protein